MPNANPRRLSKATMLELSWLAFLKFLRHPFRTTSQARYGLLLGKAFKAHHAKRHEQAVHCFDRALIKFGSSENPMLLDIYKAKAKSHQALGQHDLAQAARNEAKRLVKRPQP